MSSTDEAVGNATASLDTLPIPADVESTFSQFAGDGKSAREWLEERGIDPDKVGDVALLQYCMVWNPKTERYDFRAYDADHIGPKSQPVLAVPVREAGHFVDLLLISDDMSFETVCHRVAWLGSITPTVRLHAHPFDWIAAGYTGVCHVAPISRAALKDLRAAGIIECNDIGTALDAWSWAFQPVDEDDCADDDEDESASDIDALSRFIVDDTPEAIEAYYESVVRWYAVRVASDMEARRSW